MARAPVAGRCKTRLAVELGVEGAARLYDAMLRDTLDAYARVGAARRVVMAAPEDDGARALRAVAGAAWDVVVQRGDSLGDRLKNATRDLSAGGAAVVLVSSDSPTVSVAPVRDALATFGGARRALLGPCEDGGYYLIGLTTPELGVFDGITWSTSRVLDETRARCRALGLEVTELPSCYDVDEPADVARLGRDLARDPSLAPRVAAFLSGTLARTA
jgi:hypothetical protein